MRRPLFRLLATLLILSSTLSAQQNPTPPVANSAKGFDQQYKTFFNAFEKGDEQEMKARIAVFAIPPHWFTDVFGPDQGPALAEQYSDLFRSFTSATIGEFRSTGYIYQTQLSSRISTKPWKDSTDIKSASKPAPTSLLPLPQVQQFQIHYQTGPVRDDIQRPVSSNIVPPSRAVLAPGHNDSWVDSFIYVDGAFRFFGGGAYPFWHPCSRNGPLPGGNLIRRVQPVYPANGPREWESQPFFVQMRLTVDKDGSVKNIAIVEGDSRLVEAARRAVLQWHYEPFASCGEPIEKQLTVFVDFRPN